MKQHYKYFTIVILQSLVCFFIIIMLQTQHEKQMDQQRDKFNLALDKLKLYDVVPENINFTVNGLAWASKKIYCVHMDSSDINRTDIHEQCHIVVGSDPQHFCERYKDKIK